MSFENIDKRASLVVINLSSMHKYANKDGKKTDWWKSIKDWAAEHPELAGAGVGGLGGAFLSHLLQDPYSRDALTTGMGGILGTTLGGILGSTYREEGTLEKDKTPEARIPATPSPLCQTDFRAQHAYVDFLSIPQIRSPSLPGICLTQDSAMPPESLHKGKFLCGRHN